MSAEPAMVPALRDPEIERLRVLGNWLALSETGDKTPAALGAGAALRLHFAAELGLPPFAAGELSIIGGRLVVSAKLLRALAARAGYRVEKVASTEERCSARVVEIATGRELGSATFTMADAKRAGLVKASGSWHTWPDRMLWARAAKFAIDDAIPEVALGLLTEEERDEIVDAEPWEEPTSEPAPNAAEPLEPELDQTEAYEAETALREATEAEARRHAHRDLALIIDKLEADAVAPPSGHLGWTEYSRWVAHDVFGVDSRSELNADELQVVIEQVERAGAAG